MNNREVKKIIRQKADEKNIPNVSFLIKEKLDMAYEYQAEKVTVKKRFNLRPLYMSLAASMLVIFIVVLTLITPTTETDLFANSQFSDNVLLSAISTSELVYQNDESANNQKLLPILASTSTNYNLFLDHEESEELNIYIEDEIDEVMKYSQFIEIFFNNLDEFEKEIKKEKYLNFNKVITYQLNNMNSTISEYKLYYKQNIDKETKTYNIVGLLVAGEKEYNLTITGKLKEDAFTITHRVNESKSVKVYYENSQIKIKEYLNEETVNESTIDLSETGVRLSFIKGKHQGVYEFQMHKSNESEKRIRINYRIGNSDEGEVDFSVSDDDNNKYEVNIKPNDRPPSSIKKERKQKGRPHHELDESENPNGPNEPGNPDNPGGPKGPRGPKNKGASNNNNKN